MEVNTLKDIDVWQDFTEATPKFWDGFWERGSGLGSGGADPDSRCKLAKVYHKLLWSRTLPNGENMELEDGGSRFYLRWKDFYFGSDSITASFRYYRNQPLLQQVAAVVGDYKAFVEDYLRRLYTIGGMIIFPSGPHQEGLNCARGFNPRIKDRRDLTLECIKMYYEKQPKEMNPLRKSIYEAEHTPNQEFLNLFVDFKGFIDFFFLQDCVDKDYNVIHPIPTTLFETNPIPKDVDTYLRYIQAELDFVEKRNIRIKDFCNQ